MTQTEQVEGLEKLRKPFPDSAISYKPGGKTGDVMLAYVGHAACTDRMLEADPLWTWEPFARDANGAPLMDYDAQGIPVGLWINLTICGVTKPGYGSVQPSKYKTDYVKELIGDALRNAGMRFGIALELWAKGELESGNNGDHESAPAPAARPQPRQQAQSPHNGTAAPQRAAHRPQQAQAGAVPSCKICNGPMWDNRGTAEKPKLNPKAPDFKCRDKNCNGAEWVTPRANSNGNNRQSTAPIAPADDDYFPDDDSAPPEQPSLHEAFERDEANRQHAYAGRG